MPFNYNNIIYPEDLETPQSRAVRVGAGGRARQQRFSTEELLEAQLPQFRETRRIQRQAEIFDEERRLNERARRQAARDATIGLGIRAAEIGIQLSESPTVRRLAGRVFGREKTMTAMDHMRMGHGMQSTNIPEVQSLRIPGTGAVNKFNFGGRAETLGDFVGPPAPRARVTRAIQPKPPFTLKLPSPAKTVSPFSAFEQSRPSMTPRTAPISFSALEPGEAGANLLREGFGKSGLQFSSGRPIANVGAFTPQRGAIRGVLAPQVKDVTVPTTRVPSTLSRLSTGPLSVSKLSPRLSAEHPYAAGVANIIGGSLLTAGISQIGQAGATEALGVKQKEFDVGAAALSGFAFGGLPGAAVGAGGAFVAQNISKIGRFFGF